MTTVLAGSYERFLFGFELEAGGEGKSSALRRSFYVPVHKGPVKCVAAAAPFAATGGTDDCIHLFDVRAHADLGFLMSPGDGAVTALAFYTPPSAAAPSHLLSGTADGGIAVWRAGGEWECMKTMADHTKEVTGLAVHPSGKLFLSTARDGHLRLWNLAKGKSQFKTRVGGGSGGSAAVAAAAQPEAVAWAPGADPATYALLAGDTVSVHTVAGDGATTASLTAGGGGGGGGGGEAPGRDDRLGAFCWLSPATLAAGTGGGAVCLWDTRAPGPGPALRLDGAHGSRVKGIAPVWGGGGSGGGGGSEAAAAAATATVVAGSADGAVKVWDLRASSSAAAPSATPPAPVASASAAGARLTCLATIDTTAPNRAGVKLTPQEKSRRAKREAAAAAAAAAAAGNPPPDPAAPKPEWGVRTPVRTLSAKERRKALREALFAEGRAAKAKAKAAARAARRAARAAGGEGGGAGGGGEGGAGGGGEGGGGTKKRAAPAPAPAPLTKKQRREAKVKKEARAKKKEKARAKRKEEKKAAYAARKAAAGAAAAAAGGGA